MLIKRIHNNYRGFGINSFEEMERLRASPNSTIFELDSIKMNNKITSQASATQAIKNQLFIVGSISSSGDVSFNPNPAIHLCASDARLECKRLAVNTPGKLYVFVKLAGAEMSPIASTISY